MIDAEHDLPELAFLVLIRGDDLRDLRTGNRIHRRTGRNDPVDIRAEVREGHTANGLTGGGSIIQAEYGVHVGGRSADQVLVIQCIQLKHSGTDSDILHIQIPGDLGGLLQQGLQSGTDLNVQLLLFADLVLYLRNIRQQEAEDVCGRNIGSSLRHDLTVSNCALCRTGNTQAVDFRNNVLIQEYTQGVTDGQGEIGFIHIVPADRKVPATIPLQGFGFPGQAQVTGRSLVAVHCAEAIHPQHRDFNLFAAFPDDSRVAVFHPHRAGQDVEFLVQNAVKYGRIIDRVRHKFILLSNHFH